MYIYIYLCNAQFEGKWLRPWQPTFPRILGGVLEKHFPDTRGFFCFCFFNFIYFIFLDLGQLCSSSLQDNECFNPGEWSFVSLLYLKL